MARAARSPGEGLMGWQATAAPNPLDVARYHELEKGVQAVLLSRPTRRGRAMHKRRRIVLGSASASAHAQHKPAAGDPEDDGSVQRSPRRAHLTRA